MYKKPLSVFILMVSLSVVAFGCAKNADKKPEPANNTKQATTTTAAVISTNIATTTESINQSDWKIYQNKEFGFEVKYPENWEPNSENQKTARGKILVNFTKLFGKGRDMNRANFAITVFDSKGMNLSDWMDEYIKEPPGFTVLSKKEVKINGVDGISYELNGVVYKATMTLLKKGGEIFCLEKVSSAESEYRDEQKILDNTIDEMLNTFKYVR
ncbi:hypothetical protein HGA64_02125 [Candidatus Falkowbacteria bacterium]|nr:hypothetical protein [Candidatus Falkowbacteria bacterium]